MKTETRTRLKGGLIAAAFATAISSVGLAGPAEASTCQEQWDANPLHGYCQTATLMQSNVVDARTGEHLGTECNITVSCSYTFTYGPGGSSSATVTPSLTMGAFDMKDVWIITFCVTETTGSDGEVSYSARMDNECDQANEYDFDAVESGQFHN